MEDQRTIVLLLQSFLKIEASIVLDIWSGEELKRAS